MKNEIELKAKSAADAAFKLKSVNTKIKNAALFQMAAALTGNTLQIIKENEKDRWKGLHIIRNESSHPSDQSIFLPLEAITIVKNISNEINKLFM